MTLVELRRALTALCLLGVFGSSFIAHKDEDEHDERKARSKMIFTSEGRRVKDTTLPTHIVPGV